ncbi:hypothetical protein L6Q21_12570 [Sandaracinobacter sp. RS1-74]|uniref:hypothetical protein n=1 Tax=Sandaracinobacteroides sayramensis TaxID=2913411 RepID=UPI001EDB017B|nr:hypothetical protein [Sandaracinobacteroides sayramensis]MCG2841816.1 hypothetical protein [Sandaracinobacteroides sayramensis]
MALDVSEVEARLAEPDAFKAAVLAGEMVDVVVSVPSEAFAIAWGQMGNLIEGSMDYAGWGYSDEALRLLCGVFFAAHERLPLGPGEHFELLKRLFERLDDGRYVDEFLRRWEAAKAERSRLDQMLSAA